MLTCLYQLKSENVNLEDELASYTRRRDHLLAVNARLAIPLAPQSNLFIPINLFFDDFLKKCTKLTSTYSCIINLR